MTDFSEVFQICPTCDSFYLSSLNEIVLTARDKRETYQTQQQRRDQASRTEEIRDIFAEQPVTGLIMCGEMVFNKWNNE